MGNEITTPTNEFGTKKDKINYINETFQFSKSINQLHSMVDGIVKQEINANNVNAACNCIARLNETVDTLIKATKYLDEK